MNTYQQTQARELYLQGGLTQQQIATLIDVSRKTIGLWIQQGQWRQLRIAAQQSPAMLLQDFYNQLAVLNETIHQKGGIPTVEESIVQRRLIMNIQTFKQQPASNYMQLYTELVESIRKQDPELSKQVALHADTLIRHKTNKKRLYTAQDMFLTDEVEEDDIDNNTLNHIPPHCHIEPSPEAPADNIKQGTCEGNVTFCNISQNNNTEAHSETQPETPTKREQKNNSENEKKPQIYMLSNGIIWLGNDMVYDPTIGKKREVTFHELTQFKNLNPPPGNL